MPRYVPCACVLLSAASKPAIDQVAIRTDTNEGGMFPEVFQELAAHYATLIEIYSLDAGFCSQAHARVIAAAHKGYIIGLKGNQPELCREAQRVLAFPRPTRNGAVPGSPIKAISSAIISIAQQRWKPIWIGAI